MSIYPKKDTMKITSHHLPITSLVSRSNLRLIPLLLLLLLLGYSHGMPHVLRFGKSLFTAVSVSMSVRVRVPLSAHEPP